MSVELNEIRVALRARVQVMGVHRTAAEAWIRPSTLAGLLEGASPRGKTLGYLRTWHRALHPSAGDPPSCALRPATAREQENRAECNLHAPGTGIG